MQSISLHLKQDYNRFAKEIPENDFSDSNHVGYNDVLKAHYLICDYFENTTGERSLYGVKNFNLMGSALGRQTVSFGSAVKWTNPLDVCATLFFGLVKNHAFHDGNKRTALLTLIYQLSKMGRVPCVNQKKFERLTVQVAEGSIGELPDYKKFRDKDDPIIRTISYLLKRYTRKSDKNYYPLTYREFQSKLKQFGCSLENDRGGFIDVYAPVTKKRLLGLYKTKEVEKVKQIGFSGWTKQVRLKAVKETLKAAGLVAENGIDSQVFYKGAEPMYKLIEDFEGPLSRLKDK